LFFRTAPDAVAAPNKYLVRLEKDVTEKQQWTTFGRAVAGAGQRRGAPPSRAGHRSRVAPAEGRYPHNPLAFVPGTK